MAKINLDSMLKKAKDKGVDTKEASEKNIFDKPWKANSSVYIENTLDSNVTPNVSSNNAVINSPSSTSSTETIISIEPSEISRWSLKDRPENELGDISELARTFKEVGQQVPCIIRPAPDKNGYELIVGERRWHAAKEAGVKLKAILKNLSDHEAGLIQAIENEQRHGLSDYAKGMSYYRMIEKGILKQKDLIDKLNMSQQQVSRLLSFSKIPPEITYALKDMTKISSRTSEEIVRLSKKGESYVNAIIALAEKISSGKIGNKIIQSKVQNQIEEKKNHYSLNDKITSEDGRHLFTWRLDNNTNPSIHFPKDILKLSSEGKLSLDELSKLIKDFLKERLGNLTQNQ